MDAEDWLPGALLGGLGWEGLTAAGDPAAMLGPPAAIAGESAAPDGGLCTMRSDAGPG